MKKLLVLAVSALGFSGAANAGIDGCWNLSWIVSDSVHTSVLEMSGDIGSMLTTFEDEDEDGDTESVTVRQTMRYKHSASGDYIRGSNPIDISTNKKHPGYAADNLHLIEDESGNYSFYLIDAAQEESEIEVSECDAG